MRLLVRIWLQPFSLGNHSDVGTPSSPKVLLRSTARRVQPPAPSASSSSSSPASTFQRIIRLNAASSLHLHLSCSIPTSNLSSHLTEYSGGEIPVPVVAFIIAARRLTTSNVAKEGVPKTVSPLSPLIGAASLGGSRLLMAEEQKSSSATNKTVASGLVDGTGSR